MDSVVSTVLGSGDIVQPSPPTVSQDTKDKDRRDRRTTTVLTGVIIGITRASRLQDIVHYLTQ